MKKRKFWHRKTLLTDKDFTLTAVKISFLHNNELHHNIKRKMKILATCHSNQYISNLIHGINKVELHSPHSPIIEEFRFLTYTNCTLAFTICSVAFNSIYLYCNAKYTLAYICMNEFYHYHLLVSLVSVCTYML